MAYNAVAQQDHDGLSDGESASASPPPLIASKPFQPLQMDFDSFGSDGLFMEHEQDSPKAGGVLSNTVGSIVSKGSKPKYAMLEEDDFAQNSRDPSPVLAAPPLSRAKLGPGSQRARQSQEPTSAPKQIDEVPQGARPTQRKPIVRTASGRTVDLRHPTPDLQTLQGAYMANVEHLEKTAEKLSMTSSIDDAIRQMHDEQKRSDSRRSSLLASPTDMPSIVRQFSNPNSIIEMNSAARSGGYSPGGFNMTSPQNSFTNSNRGHSASKGSRFGTRPEPELEGRPLDHLANHSTASPHLSRSASIAEEHEEDGTFTLPILEPMQTSRAKQAYSLDDAPDRPTTSASATTFEQAQKLFRDFDGEHYNARSREPSETRPKVDERRVSSGNRLSTALPPTFADPGTGQKMVYYPAPVPIMLNLPQKLSNKPSAMTRDKRRTQVLSSIPPAARKSAVWLPDVLEDEGDAFVVQNDPTQQQEYMPQHQRRSMGGRRSMMDVEHMPPQLRASTFFEPEGINQVVEVKGESAVATLDSILDASAFAPVSAFTDHAFAGRLGAEVYGAAKRKTIRPVSEIPGKTAQKRKSFSNILHKRASSSDLLLSGGNGHRHSTMSGLPGKNRPGRPSLEGDEDDEEFEHDGDEEELLDDDEDEEEDDEDEPHPDDIVYHGAPTTLLAELQIRKQQQKMRTRHVATAYPNGMHSTLLEMDAVAQVEKKTRNQKRVNLAWEDPNMIAIDGSDGGDEDVPLAMLFPHKSSAHIDRSRPMGLMERREMEDNEPLSQRRDRLQGKPPRALARASTMVGVSTTPQEDESETLAQRIQRLKSQGGTATGLPAPRPVSGDFTTELMSQFGGDTILGAKKDAKGKGRDVPDAVPAPPPEDEETLGQRRKRLQAEREAREKEVGGGGDTVTEEQRPQLKSRLSMADILTAHPAAGAGGSRSSSYNLSNGANNKPSSGLLGLHERQSMQHLSSLQQLSNQHLQQQQQQPLINNNNHAPQQPQQQQQYEPGYGYGGHAQAYQPPANAYGFGFGAGPMQGQMQGQGQATYRNQTPLNLGQYPQLQPMPMGMGMGMPFANAYSGITAGYGGGANMGMGGGAGLGIGGGAYGSGLGGVGVGYQNPMAASMLQMQGLGQELNQKQIEMVERWRRSVMQ